ncbi:MAG: DUF6768 family protein [Bacteroidota bacterium]
MNTKTDDIDKLIKEALNEEEAAFYDKLEEKGLFDMVANLYSGKLKGWVYFTTFLNFSFAAVAFFCSVKFLESEEVYYQIRWGAGMFLSWISVSMIKLWNWMQLDKNTLLREIKRLELQIASMAKKVS